jgi:drug/metabolite transporter (DMT)-like permease
MKQEQAGKPAPWLGWGAALLMVVIGAGWQLATRAGARSALAPIDLSLIRYVVPAFLLAPVWWRTGLLPAAVGRGRLALIVIGAGLPFGLLAMSGARLAPAAHMGALLPGASPLLVALLGWAWLGRRPGRLQSAGLLLLATGLAVVALPAWSTGSDGSWAGDLLFLAAAVAWSLYTLALRGGALDPWQAAALVSIWSALGVVPLWLAAFFTDRSLLLTAPAEQLWLQLLWQGVIAGVVGLAAWGVAVKGIGATSASALGALVPAVVAVGGWRLLGEPLDLSTSLGVLTVIGGVVLAARAPR